MLTNSDERALWRSKLSSEMPNSWRLTPNQSLALIDDLNFQIEENTRLVDDNLRLDALNTRRRIEIERLMKGDRVALADGLDVVEENMRLKVEVEHLRERLTATYCAYCGHTEPRDDELPHKISKHIAVCPKHPMRITEAKLEAAQIEIKTLRAELSQMTTERDTSMGQRDILRKHLDTVEALVSDDASVGVIPHVQRVMRENKELRNELTTERERHATHRCKICGAKWTLWSADVSPVGVGPTWSLASVECGKCCDNQEMGSQIEPIGLTAIILGLKKENDELKKRVADLDDKGRCAVACMDNANDSLTMRWEDIKDLREKLEAVRKELDEADRRAGFAERKSANVYEEMFKHHQWNAEQKKARGYDGNVSFDIVWRETCEKADKNDKSIKDLEEARERINKMVLAIVNEANILQDESESTPSAKKSAQYVARRRELITAIDWRPENKT